MCSWRLVVGVIVFAFSVEDGSGWMWEPVSKVDACGVTCTDAASVGLSIDAIGGAAIKVGEISTRLVAELSCSMRILIVLLCHHHCPDHVR